MYFHLLPIQIWLPFLGYDWTGAYPAHIGEEILSNMPQMLPLRRSDLQVTMHRIPYVFPSVGLITPHTAAANIICSMHGALLPINLALELYNWRMARAVFSSEPLDILVAVLPANAMSGLFMVPGDGANVVLHRAVAFLDETKAGAIHHETCHAFGLWTGTEQYDMYQPYGQPLTAMTALPQMAKAGQISQERIEAGSNILHRRDYSGRIRAGMI